MRPRDARQARFAQIFAQIIAVLMRDPKFRNLRLADLEWLVLPPVMAGQWRLAQAKPEQRGANSETTLSNNSMLVPVAVALWASVSPAIDKRLSEDLDKPLLLRPNEWASGDILWLVAVAGDQRAVPTFLRQLRENEFKTRSVKLRSRGTDGKVVVTNLSPAESTPQ